MIRLVILLFVCSLMNVPVCAQTLHAIIFANTKSPGNPNNPRDPGIGPSVTVDFERMGIEMTSIASFIGYNLKKYYYYGNSDRFNRNNLVNLLNSFSCRKDDIIFFYYSGHGGRYENEGSDYPEMILKVQHGASDKDLFSLHETYKKLKSKGSRLTIVMGDLCNSTWKGAYKPTKSSKSASVKSSSVCDVYKNLFLNVKGGLIAASSKPGHTSGCAQYSDGTDAGGVFTASFLQCLGDYVSQGEEVSWNNLLEESRNMAQSISRGDNKGERQYPIFDTSDLVKAELPSSSTQTQTNTHTTSNDVQTTSYDNLADALSAIANDKSRPVERIRVISPTMTKYFANPQARVQVVGRDSKTIVNTTTASSYLNYLSIATKMEQIMVLEEKKADNGKILYLKVHEMHRE